MKVTFNLGAVSVNFTQAARSSIESMTTHIDGVRLATPVNVETSTSPAKTGSFTMGESSYTFEAEVGEIAGIYRELIPMVTEIVGMFKGAVVTTAPEATPMPQKSTLKA